MSEHSLHDADPLRRRKRAPSMAPEDRREQLIEAALPLVREHGAAITTAQVAQAAGVAEGTLFRSFADKDSLLDAVLERALDASLVIESLDALEAELGVHGRVTEAAELIREHFSVALPVMHGAMQHGAGATRGFAVGAMFLGLLDATERLFEREHELGRVHGEPQTLSRMLVGLCQSLAWQDFFDHRPSRVLTRDVVAVVLDGCVVRAKS